MTIPTQAEIAEMTRQIHTVMTNRSNDPMRVTLAGELGDDCHDDVSDEPNAAPIATLRSGADIKGIEEYGDATLQTSICLYRLNYR